LFHFGSVLVPFWFRFGSVLVSFWFRFVLAGAYEVAAAAAGQVSWS
jgi:hypothetical protein